MPFIHTLLVSVPGTCSCQSELILIVHKSSMQCFRKCESCCEELIRSQLDILEDKKVYVMYKFKLRPKKDVCLFVCFLLFNFVFLNKIVEIIIFKMHYGNCPKS